MSSTSQGASQENVSKETNSAAARPRSNTAFVISLKKDKNPPTDSAVPVLSAYGYALGDQLGKGSYAIVKAAYSRKHQKQVAIKIVTKKKAPDDYLTKFLPREIQVMKQLDHPNVVRMHEAIETSSRIYLILDLADNGDLLEYIRTNGALKEDKAGKFFKQLLDAVDYIHNHGIVHRDLKCENLLLNRDEQIFLSDFGFARSQPAHPETKKRRLSQTFCGSYAYAPPEILRGIAYDGTFADIWSLGVVLYTMVCACLPFDDSNLKVLLEQVSRKLAFPRRRVVSQELKHLIAKMLTCDVSQRIDIERIRQHPWYLGNRVEAVNSGAQANTKCTVKENAGESKDDAKDTEVTPNT